MRAVEGIYDNGVVTLTDTVSLARKQEVTVLVPEEEKLDEPPALKYIGMLKDLTPEQERAFDEALARGIWFKRKVHI